MIVNGESLLRKALQKEQGLVPGMGGSSTGKSSAMKPGTRSLGMELSSTAAATSTSVCTTQQQRFPVFHPAAVDPDALVDWEDVETVVVTCGGQDAKGQQFQECHHHHHTLTLNPNPNP